MTINNKSVVRRSVWPANAGTPVVTPLCLSVVHHYEDADQLQSLHDGEISGFDYARDGHPNAEILSEKISWLEGASSGLMTASGMSAITAVLLSFLNKGDRVAAATQLYGRSLRMMKEQLPRMGFETSFFDGSDPSSIDQGIGPETKIILAEIVSNPMLRVTHFEALVQKAKSIGALLLVDNTFTTPNGYKPLENGADLVMNSVTKMLSGHSDLNLGYIGSKNDDLIHKIKDIIGIYGLNSSPYNCWMAERGLHTFDLRYQRANTNAQQLADFLNQQSNVLKVVYPKLESHPDHTMATKMLKNGFGSMVSFVLDGKRDEANAFLRSAENIPYCPTLGDVATTIIMPALSSHRKFSPAERLALGVEDNLIRVSVGIENFDLIKDDFSTALEAARTA
jgi:cystathionine gamma-synthase